MPGEDDSHPKSVQQVGTQDWFSDGPCRLYSGPKTCLRPYTGSSSTPSTTKVTVSDSGGRTREGVRGTPGVVGVYRPTAERRAPPTPTLGLWERTGPPKGTGVG